MDKVYKIPVGISKPLYERIRQRAEAAKRSITGEVEFELEQYERFLESEKQKGESNNDV